MADEAQSDTDYNMFFEAEESPEPEQAEVEEGEEIAVDDEPEEDPEEDDQDEDEEGDEDDAEPKTAGIPDDTLVDVKVDGQEMKVSLADLKSDYSGREYIREGMKRNAALAREVQTQREKLAEFAQSIQQQGIIAPPQPPDLRDFDDHPFEFMRAEAKYSRDLQAYQEQQRQMIEQTQMHQRLQEQTETEHLAEQRKILAKAIPGYSDSKKGDALRRKIAETAVDVYGISADELNEIKDARYVQVLHDAAQWRDLQKSTGAMKEQVAKARPVLKPGQGRPAPATRKQHSDTLKRARSGDDAAIASLLFDTPTRKRKG